MRNQVKTIELSWKNYRKWSWTRPGAICKFPDNVPNYFMKVKKKNPMQKIEASQVKEYTKKTPLFTQTAQIFEKTV